MDRRSFLRRLIMVPAAVAGAKLPLPFLRRSDLPIKEFYPGRISVPAFPIYSNPMISLDEIRTRKFDVFATPLMRRLDYQGIARAALHVEPLSPGALEATYETT